MDLRGHLLVNIMAVTLMYIRMAFSGRRPTSDADTPKLEDNKISTSEYHEFLHTWFPLVLQYREGDERIWARF
jgi:hypothetical protein